MLSVAFLQRLVSMACERPSRVLSQYTMTGSHGRCGCRTQMNRQAEVRLGESQVMHRKTCGLQRCERTFSAEDSVMGGVCFYAA